MLHKAIKQFGILVVDHILPFTRIDALIEHTRGLENAEGFVIAFGDGHKLKIKADQYVRIHKALERVRYDRNIIALILNEEIDDVVPLMPPHEMQRIREFEEKFWTAFKAKEKAIQNLYFDATTRYDNDRKCIALEFVPTLEHKADASFIFRMLDGHDLRELMLSHIEKHISSNPRWETCAEWLVYNV